MRVMDLDFVQHQAGQVASEASVGSVSAQQPVYKERPADRGTVTWADEPAVRRQ